MVSRRVTVGVVIIFVILAGLWLFNTVSNHPINTAGVVNNPAEANKDTVKEFSMTAKDFAFDPDTITVNQGDTVVLHIKSIDVKHGFALPDFGVSQDLSPGEEVTVRFVADKKGTFPFFCNVFCGAGHREMTGTLIVN